MDRLPKFPMMASMMVAALLAAGGLHTARAAAEPDPSTPQASTDSATVSHSPTRVEIRGFVHDANGSPVRGATIRLTSETDTVRVQSDGTGRFRARITATNGVRVLVQAYGYRDMARSFRASHAVIQAALSLPPPYPLGWVTVTMADELKPLLDSRLQSS